MTQPANLISRCLRWVSSPLVQVTKHAVLSDLSGVIGRFLIGVVFSKMLLNVKVYKVWSRVRFRELIFVVQSRPGR